MNQKPRIAITMGDAAGIGPEITLKALADRQFTETFDCTVIGDAAHLRGVVSRFGFDAAIFDSFTIEDLANLPEKVEIGIESGVTGRASAEYIVRAVELWRAGRIDAVVTAPINKAAIKLGGYDYPGHTEFLAELTDTARFAMSFFAGNLRVVLLSTHLSLRHAIEKVKMEPIAELIRFSSETLGQLLNRKPKIAVAGLNPHASEGGLFGIEEAEEIIPAVELTKREGVDVSGPYSPDTVFHRCSMGEFDAVIALYHDQATIPVKSLAFNSGVNVTLGLPLIRTSVDHGTAFDIAGKGIAEADSMRAAITVACELASAK